MSQFGYDGLLSPDDSMSNIGPPDQAYYQQYPQMYPQQPQMYPQQPQMSMQQQYMQGPPFYPGYGYPAEAYGQPAQQAYMAYAAPPSRHRSSRSRRHHSNSHSASNLGLMYVPSASLSGSGSTLVASPNPTYSTYSSPSAQYAVNANPYVVGPYTAQPSQLLQPPQVVYPQSASPYGSYTAAPSASGLPYAAMLSPPLSSAHSHHSASSHRSSRSHGSSRSHRSSRSSERYSSASASPTPSGQGWIQPNPGQPVVLPIGNNGGYVVVPAAGQNVSVIHASEGQHQYSHGSDHGKASFFGTLLGRKSKGRKRAGSY